MGAHYTLPDETNVQMETRRLSLEEIWSSLYCRELSCSLRKYTHTHKQNYNICKNSKYTPHHRVNSKSLFFSLKLTLTGPPLGNSLWITFREMERENIKRRDKLSERMSEREREDKSESTEEFVLLISSAWSYGVNVLFYLTIVVLCDGFKEIKISLKSSLKNDYMLWLHICFQGKGCLCITELHALSIQILSCKCKYSR